MVTVGGSCAIAYWHQCESAALSTRRCISFGSYSDNRGIFVYLDFRKYYMKIILNDYSHSLLDPSDILALSVLPSGISLPCGICTLIHTIPFLFLFFPPFLVSKRIQVVYNTVPLVLEQTLCNTLLTLHLVVLFNVDRN